MALAHKLTKEAHGKLSAELQKEYVADGEGFKLDVTDYQDDSTGELRRALAREKEERKAAKAAAEAAEAKLAEVDSEKARKAGDIATLEKSWKEKSDKELAEKDGIINKYKAHTEKQLVQNVAQKLATDLAGENAAVLIPHILPRLAANLDGDEFGTRVLDATGKISASTVADLQKEFASNKIFSAIIKASKASGSGATQTTNNTQSHGGAVRPDANTDPRTDPNNPANMSRDALQQRIADKIAAKTQG